MSERPPDSQLVDDFDYELPEDLIAQTPLQRRDTSRLLVVDKSTGALTHTQFTELPGLLEPGDLLVANNTRVLHARLTGRRGTGGKVELLLLRRDAFGIWEALAKPARRLAPGEQISIEPRDPLVTDPIAVAIVERGAEGLVKITFADPSHEQLLGSIGGVPLPPYIHAALDDPDRYQTTYATVTGSAAAPTAGLHFTNEIRARLMQRGVGWTEVTLHVGLDTFRPVTVQRIGEHKMHSEWCHVPESTVEAIQRAKREGHRVIAVGTTSARTLETIGQLAGSGPINPYSGPTSIFITPGYGWTIVDGLVTNFHLPKSTLLMMVSALAGREAILAAYREAIDRRYRFFSFGDAMLIV